MMKDWPALGSRTRVAHMTENDFYGSEKSTTLAQATNVTIQFVANDGHATVLKEKVSVLAGEVIDSAVMRVAALRTFFSHTIKEAENQDALLSLHLKATMMKVSDPVMFGHCVSVYYEEALKKHADTLREIGANVNNGLAGVLGKLSKLPAAEKG